MGDWIHTQQIKINNVTLFDSGNVKQSLTETVFVCNPIKYRM
jgi:hypothetical protein